MKRIYQRVVLIDDEPIQNKIHKTIIQRYFGNHSIEIVNFTDPAQALLYLEDESEKNLFTLVLLDLTMPYMSGWEFLDHLSKVNMSQTIIYIVSSSVARADIERAESHPKITGYTRKPLSSAVNGLLVDTLAALESSHQKQ